VPRFCSDIGRTALQRLHPPRHASRLGPQLLHRLTPEHQLILPEAFKALPMYILGLLKSKPLKTRIGTSDVRNYHAHRIRGMSAQAIMNYLYPRLLALHDLDDAIALPDSDGHIAYPAHMRASYVFMEAHGIYLIGSPPPWSV
jgi:hypothetical protein